MRAQYEQVLAESHAGASGADGAGATINLSEEQQALEQRRWGDRREREVRQQLQLQQQESENRLFELDVSARRDTSPRGSLANLSPTGWSASSMEASFETSFDSPPRPHGSSAAFPEEEELIVAGSLDLSQVRAPSRNGSSPELLGESDDQDGGLGIGTLTMRGVS